MTREQLKLDIAHIKEKLNQTLSKQEEDILEIRAELAKMEAELEKSEKVELEGGSFFFDTIGTINCRKDTHIIPRQFGAERATKELAEIASKNMVARNKLEAWVAQIQGNSEGTYSIYLLLSNNKYSYIENHLNFTGSVRMYKSTAETLCQWLNEGRITLEKE